MTEQAQRIAIAKVCGWEFIPSHDHRATGQAVPDKWEKDGMEYFEDMPLPDFLNDLNAMHEAENTLDRLQGEMFAGFLSDMTNKFDGDAWKHSGYALAHATAAQRAEAFLKTLGLWKG